MNPRHVLRRVLALLPDRVERALRHAVDSARDRRSGASPPGAAPRPAPLVPIPEVAGRPSTAGVRAPSVMLLAIGLDEDGLADLVDALLRLLERVDGARVLLVVDCDAFHVLREHRLLFEYLPPRERWADRTFGLDYDAFRRARLAELLQVYAPDRLVHLSSADDLRGLPLVLFGPA